MKTTIFLIGGVVILLSGSCQQSGNNSATKVKLENLIDSTSYAVGMQFGENLRQNLNATPGGDVLNIEALAQGFKTSAMGGETELSLEDAEMTIRKYFQAEAENQAQKNLEEGNAFLESNGKREGVTTTESGLQYEIIREGQGPKPKDTDKVTVHYHGTLIDGSVFDSSRDREEPVTFPVNGVISGWTEALQLMPAGSVWKLYIPSNLAYGERGSQNAIQPNSVLIFEVELISVSQ